MDNKRELAQQDLEGELILSLAEIIAAPGAKVIKELRYRRIQLLISLNPQP